MICDDGDDDNDDVKESTSLSERHQTLFRHQQV